MTYWCCIFSKYLISWIKMQTTIILGNHNKNFSFHFIPFYPRNDLYGEKTFRDIKILQRKLKPISPVLLTIISQNKILTWTLILLSILGWNFWLIVPRTASTEAAETPLLPIFYFRFNGFLLAAGYFTILTLTFWHQNCAAPKVTVTCQVW